MELVRRFTPAALLLFPFLAAADVSDVRVLGVTATQAIISYTAPDTGSCTVTASTSPSYTPPVYDLDPSLFEGARSDARAGSISIGRARLFVIGRRTVEKDLAGVQRSRALQAATTYYFRVTCPSTAPGRGSAGRWHSAASGSFVTSTIPAGLGYGDPIPVDPAGSGAYALPAISTTDRWASVVDPHTGGLVKNLTLPGDYTGAVGFGMTNTSGIGYQCHPTPVKASDEDKFGYHCQVMVSTGNSSTPALYWIASDGETRNLGPMLTSYAAPDHNVLRALPGLSAPFDYASDPNVFYCYGNPTDQYDKVILVKVTYRGHETPGDDADLTGQATLQLKGTPHSVSTQIVPGGRDLLALTREFDPNYAAYGGALPLSFRAGDWANGKFIFYLVSKAQDTFGWIAVFDPKRTPAEQQAASGSAAGCIDNTAVTGLAYVGQTGCIVASTGTFSGGAGSKFRWSVLHSVDVTPASPYISVTLNALSQKQALDYRVTLMSALSSTSSPCAMAKPADSIITDWPSTGWEQGCSTIRVLGAPVLAGSFAGYPATLAAQPGDLLSTNSADYNHREVLRLLDKGADGNTWYVQRQYYYRTDKNGAYCTGEQTGCKAVYANAAVPEGGTLGMLAPAVYYNANVTGMQVWWDPERGARQTDSSSTYTDPLPQGHPTYINHSAYGRWTYVAGKAVAGMEPDRLVKPPAPIVMEQAPFNGLPASGSGANGPTLETHPTLSATNAADELTYRQMSDNHPYMGCYNGCQVNASNVSQVTGQLYRITGTNVAANYKLTPHFANSGSRAMREVSGPEAALASDGSTQFQWCVALRNDECRAGSQSGDIYFNAPGIENRYCTNNWTKLQTTTAIPNDICVSRSNPYVQGIEIRTLASDPQGRQSRALSASFSPYESQSSFWNSRTLPDGSWVFTPLLDGGIKMIKVPPPDQSSVNRSAYIPLEVTVPGVAGADRAVVLFGYGENGKATDFFCTARQEACAAQESALNASEPFRFLEIEAGAISGAPCAGGCTITIPAAPGRVLYYRVAYRDSSGKTVGYGTMSATAVP